MDTLLLQNVFSRKLQLIKAICINNESIGRLLKRRNLRAVRRLLRERAALIEELAAATTQLSDMDEAWTKKPAWQAVVQTIQQLQADTLSSCRQLIRQAAAERQSIAAELKSIKTAQHLKSQYASPWKGLNTGRRLSVKG